MQSMLLVACRPPPERPRMRCASNVTLTFDETTERICMPLDEAVTSATVSDHWHVLVSTVDVNVCYVPQEGAIHCSAMSVVRSPVPVANVGAPALFHGIFGVPVNRPFEQYATVLTNTTVATR